MNYPTWEIFSVAASAGLTLLILQKPKKFLTILVMLIASVVLFSWWGLLGTIGAIAYKLWKKE